MSTVNAPQPAASGPAESFDSTVAAPTGNISSVGLPGPNNAEAPIHTGQMNGVDPFFHRQYMALAQFTWTVSDDPAKLLWSIPIHPSETHQWLAHLAKMYNAWAGGINFALKIAGTGFHAGAIMVARIPPNIQPSKLLTVADVTAFEYTVMDPKMLEVEIKSVMDQRNIMYHYMPLDVTNKQSFGGYIAVYVMLPLATSSTGATEISIQVLAQPALNFTFSQIRPINVDVVPVAIPKDIEKALEFTSVKTSPTVLEEINKLTVWSLKSKRVLKDETLNCVKFSKDPMNGYFLPRHGTTFAFKNMNKWITKNIALAPETDNTGAYFYFPPGDSVFAWELNQIEGSSVELPTFEAYGWVVMQFLDKQKNFKYSVRFFCNFSAVNKATDPVEIRDLKMKALINYYTSTGTGMGINFPDANFGFTPKSETEIYSYFAEGRVLPVAVELTSTPVWSFSEMTYAPPIEESLITFQSPTSESAQPFELREVLAAGPYSGFMAEGDALVFEIVDIKVDLPVLPVKLHYAGYFTTIAHQSNMEFKMVPADRYEFRYVYKTRATTPLVAGRKIATYLRNQAVSQIVS